MYKIISDTACDFTPAQAEKSGVSLVPFYVTFDMETYRKDIVELPVDEFYSRMLNEKVFPKTSLPSIQDYVDIFLPYAEKNIPVISITISTLFSGSYNSACSARDLILEDHPDARIAVINSQLNSAAQGLLVYEAVRMNQDNIPFEKAVATLEKLSGIGTVYFTIESLDYLKKGGRIGKAASLLTNALSIRPIIYMQNGEISIAGISRTRTKAKKAVIDAIRKRFADNHLNYEDYDYLSGHATNPDEWKEFLSTAEESLGIKSLETLYGFDTKISVVTGCHTGPYTIGLGFMPKYETVIDTI